MPENEDLPSSSAVRAAADGLIREFGVTDLLELADAVERAGTDQRDSAAFLAVAAELRRRAASGVRFWPRHPEP